MLNDILPTLFLFYEQIHIRPRDTAVYLINYFDANSFLESFSGIVKLIQVTLKVVVKVLQMILL